MDRLEEIKTKMKVERPEYFNSVSLTDAHWLVTEIERLRKKIVRAYACIEDKLYDKALNILQQALKER